MSKFKIGDEVLICEDRRDSDPYWVGKHGTVCDVLPVKGWLTGGCRLDEADTWDVQVNVEDMFDESCDAPWFDETELELV